MRPSVILIIASAFIGSLVGGFFIFNAEKKIIIENVPQPAAIATTTLSAFTPGVDEETPGVEPTKEQAMFALIVEAKEKSNNIKGIYIGSSKVNSYFKTILDETELNGLVIDVKESYGPNLPLSLKNSISELHKQDVWAIARIVAFRDSSLTEDKPEWYLAFTTTTDNNATTSLLWQDNAKQYWLDPQNKEVQNYLIEFSKKAIDYGFDELQFDYIRYPDNYKYVSGQEKIKVIGDFFSKLSRDLRNYKSSIILSADLFGYVATQFNSYDIGQRLIDAAKYFDYISFMLYPSHFYGGFAAPEDQKRQITAVYFPYKDGNTTSTSHLVSSNPYEVVSRSIFSSIDYLDFYGIKIKIRPWLQDFDLKADTNRGIFYDAEKVRLEISAAEDAGSSGWLLWNPLYIYTKEALETE